jgi:YidC/Oxa1 family membrane protein insertase
MDFQRLFLFLIFSFSVFLLWDGWQRTQNPSIQTVAASGSSAASAPVATAIGEATPGANAVAAQQKSLAGNKITVKTDRLVAEISTVGGDLRRMEFLQQYDANDRSKPFVLLQEQGTHTYIAQTGLLGTGLPTHNTIFTAEASDYQLAQGKDTLEVRLSATEVSGAKVSKVYIFHRGSYLVDVGYEIENNGTNPFSSSAYFQLVRDTSSPEGSSQFVPTYTGPAVFTEQEKFQKVDFADIEKGKNNYPKSADNGWVGMLQHYFVTAWLPKDKVQREFYTKHLENNLYSVGLILPVGVVAPGQSTKISVPLYAGPAQASLDKIAPGLGLTVDYGWLTIISSPLFWVALISAGLGAQLGSRHYSVDRTD